MVLLSRLHISCVNNFKPSFPSFHYAVIDIECFEHTKLINYERGEIKNRLPPAFNCFVLLIISMLLSVRPVNSRQCHEELLLLVYSFFTYTIFNCMLAFAKFNFSQCFSTKVASLWYNSL